MWRHRVLAGALLTGLLTGRVSAQVPILFGFLDGETHASVRRAAESAATRLRRPDCQALFSDFSDASGRRLSTRLAASGRTPVEAFALVRFFEDRDAPQCLTGVTLAFTEIGSPVFRMCGRQFKDRFLANRRATEYIMIHEFLHTLGLGENPPKQPADHGIGGIPVRGLSKAREPRYKGSWALERSLKMRVSGIAKSYWPKTSPTGRRRLIT